MFCKSEYKVGVANYFWFNTLGETTVFNKDCFHFVSQSGLWERVVDGRPWRAAAMGFRKKNYKVDFWRQMFQKSVIAGRESGPWTAGRDGLLGWTFETNGTDSWRRLLQKSVRADRGGGPWTDVRDGPLGWTFETNGTSSSRRLFQKSVRADRGGGPWTDVRDGPLGWTFETNGTSSSRRLFQKSVRAGRGGRAVDGRPWRAAGMDFWNKRHEFLTPIVSEVCQSGPWGAGRGRPSVTGRWDGLLKQTARLPCADCFKSQSERAVGAGRGRTSVTGRWDGLLKQTARVPHADCFRSLSERAVGAGRGRTSVAGRWDGLLKRMAKLPTPIVSEVRQSGPWGRAVDGRPWRAAGMDFWNEWHSFPRRLFQKFVRAGRGRTAVTGCWDELLKQMARIPGDDCFKSLSKRAVV